MNEIVYSNFEELYPKVESALKNASFIAIDCEFSGIRRKSIPDLSLFDSMQHRYEKLREHVDPYIIIQIGLTAFTFIRDENKYKAEPFKFFLLPRPLPFDDRQFSCQVGAIEFLTQHNFQFDKLHYSGISYLDCEQEITLRETLQSDHVKFNNLMSNSKEDEEKRIKVIDEVYHWLKNPDLSDKTFKIECENILQRYFLQKLLRNSFRKVWTEYKNNKIFVIKVSSETKQVLNECDNKLTDELFNYYLGFSKIFKLLLSLKKPIVGHNVFLDLLFIYKQFYKPLPKNYSDFKIEINQLFPSIYDTKFISYELKKNIKSGLWKSNILSDLYKFFTHEDGIALSFSAPKIKLMDDIKIDDQMFHDAGWDSYYCGFCFIKCAYVHTTLKRKSSSANMFSEFTNAELFHGIKDYINCVNIIRADLAYIKLDGSDPLSTRPPWLSIQTKSSNYLEMSDLLTKLSSFRPVEIKPYSEERVLIACSNYNTARAIMKHLSTSNNYQVAVYNPLRESLKRKSIFWSGLIVSGGLVTWFIGSLLRKSSPGL